MLNNWLANNGGATSSDACGLVVWSHDYIPFQDDDECEDLDSLLVVFTATDECGNTSTVNGYIIFDEEGNNQSENEGLIQVNNNQSQLIATQQLKTNHVVEIYPNPSKGDITIQLDVEFSNQEYTIYDANGRVVQRGIFGNSLSETINLANLITGVYTIHFEVNGEFLHKRIVKIR